MSENLNETLPQEPVETESAVTEGEIMEPADGPIVEETFD